MCTNTNIMYINWVEGYTCKNKIKDKCRHTQNELLFTKNAYWSCLTLTKRYVDLKKDISFCYFQDFKFLKYFIHPVLRQASMFLCWRCINMTCHPYRAYNNTTKLFFTFTGTNNFSFFSSYFLDGCMFLLSALCWFLFCFSSCPVPLSFHVKPLHRLHFGSFFVSVFLAFFYFIVHLLNVIHWSVIILLCAEVYTPFACLCSTEVFVGWIGLFILSPVVHRGSF